MIEENNIVQNIQKEEEKRKNIIGITDKLLDAAKLAIGNFNQELIIASDKLEYAKLFKYRLQLLLNFLQCPCCDIKIKESNVCQQNEIIFMCINKERIYE